jgi:hypothetical protein
MSKTFAGGKGLSWSPLFRLPTVPLPKLVKAALRCVRGGRQRGFDAMARSPIRRYIRHGTLQQLAVFEACARLGSFTRAGQEMHLAQPTVSTQIKKLTDAVGTPLFRQTGKRMYLTEAGRCLYSACIEIFETLTESEQTLAQLRETAGAETVEINIREPWLQNA